MKAVLLLTALLAPGLASAQTGTATVATTTSTSAEIARLHAEAGRNFYRAGKYVEALEEFKKADRIEPSSAITYNIARCHERLSQWEEAINAYEKYVKEATDPRDKAEALDKIELLKQKLGPDASSPEARYEARIQAGRKAYAKGDYETAIDEFKAAFDIKPTTSALFNIAKSYEKMGRYEEAIDNYQQYLDLDPTATDRADVEETIKRLKKSITERYQELSVSSDPPGADIYLDDRNTGLQGQTNFRFKLTPGPHTLFLDANGFEPVKRDFVMPDDKPLALDFKMTKLENVGYLEIKASKDGARIFVDGAIIGLSPYREKKAVTAGKHQVQIELAAHDRWVGEFDVGRDQTVLVDAALAEYDAPIADDSLSAWGRNLMLVGIIGGALGVAGPFAFQKIFRGRPGFEQLGPASVDGTPFYEGPLDKENPNYRGNTEVKTLRIIQLTSLITGSVLTVGGFAFFIYKWARPTPAGPVTQADGPGLGNFAIVPTEDGAVLGLGGSF
jgi:tetratricopeptide (TPR) repeat protein